ncbi:hypothetical protein GOBAR_AA08405 [Gossypium barbadense]|uniref:Hexosyltransferase n=1 Tax=Gossypium barbadense TaxID=3634 RepID=A0A2P5Y9H6_GOSBA|nr:hypothetical protein GOBAR_AA08405 [Gossypium barbadense]
MRSRGSSNRLPNSGGFGFHSRISALVLSMFATMATIYVAARMWQDAESRVYLIQQLHTTTALGNSAISVDNKLKVEACREQVHKLSALEMDLSAARQEGFVSKERSENGSTHSKKRLLAVIGIITTFGRKKNRDAIRKAWMGSGAALRKLEEKGIVVRFVIGRSANRRDSLDREIDNEHRQTDDIIVLNQVEAPEEYTLGATLSAHSDKPRVYMGCMKSGQVFSEPTHKWYEPDWWKFGDAKSYFRHASGEIYAISSALAQFISINRFDMHSHLIELTGSLANIERSFLFCSIAYDVSVPTPSSKTLVPHPGAWYQLHPESGIVESLTLKI